MVTCPRVVGATPDGKRVAVCGRPLPCQQHPNRPVVSADFASILERLAGAEPTEEALTEAATWLTRVLNVLADCGYRLVTDAT